jgi:hypothetical protein
MLFPELGPGFNEENDNSLLARMATFYKDSITINQAFWEEASVDTRFEAGDQTLWADMYGHMLQGRHKQFNFNRVRRVVNMISGWQRRNRKSTVVTPVENGDAETSDQFTKLLMWANQREGILETLSEAFQGALVTGMGLVQVWTDFRSDPVSGNIKVDNCAYNEFLIDPFFKKKDLSDCNAIWKRSYLSRKECMSLLPDHIDDILSLPAKDDRDGKFNYMPESFNTGTKNLLAYDEFYYKDQRKQRMLVDTVTGETLEWKSSAYGEGDDDKNLKEYLKYYPRVTVVESEVPTVKMAVVVQGRVMYDGPNTMGIDRYPFIPVFGYFSPQMADYAWRIQGVVRGLRDAQYLYNRRKIIELDILESQITSGFKYKVDALVNPKDVFLAGQGRGLAIKQDAQMTDVEQLRAPDIPPSMIQLSELLGKEIQEISGVNEELLGSATDDKAGILSMLRQGAGLTTLQTLFDQLDYSQKLVGGLMIDIMQANFTPGKVERIIEQEPTEQFYNKAFGKYDAAVEEGVNTTTQRQMQFTQLIQLKELGVTIPDEVLLEATTLQNKKDLIEAVTQANQQEQQAQQMQLESETAEARARIELAEARATADEGLGIERISRVQENEAFAVERRAEARKDSAQGMLNIVKAIKEIDDIDLAQLEKLITLSKVLNTQEKIDEGAAAAAPLSKTVAQPVVSQPVVSQPVAPQRG